MLSVFFLFLIILQDFDKIKEDDTMNQYSDNFASKINENIKFFINDNLYYLSNSYTN